MQMTDMQELVSLSFALEVEDDWPPVAAESLPFTIQKDGFSLQKPPLFVKDLSVDDVIAVTGKRENLITSWEHISKSTRTTVWLLRLKQTDEIDPVLHKLRKLGCNTVGLDSAGCYSIDVPENIDIAKVDSYLSQLDAECVAIAFPSMRHPE